MKYRISRFRTAGGQAGFSLVEVTLAVGIMAFSLVGILGVLPIAMTSGRQSFNQARASAVANTLFASIRNQPFNDVHYLDSQYTSEGVPTTGDAPTLNLNTYGPTAGSTGGATATSAGSAPDRVDFYARFLDAPSDASQTGDSLGDVRRLCFTSSIPLDASGNPYSGEVYLVQMWFNNAPDGTIVPATGTARLGQANRITAVVSVTSAGAEARRKSLNSSAPGQDPFRFVTTVANRLN